MTVKDEVLIIGGGINGLCTAWYLHKLGYGVRIIDKSQLDGGASFVNAGFITPSHIVPLASPGVISKALLWMFRKDSPFYMKPRLDMDWFRWLWLFYRSATAQKVDKAVPVLKDLSLLSKGLWQELETEPDLDFSLEKKGILVCYSTSKSYTAENRVAKRAAALQLEVKHLDYKELHQLEPQMSRKVKGAFWYECDWHSTPNKIMPVLIQALEKRGAQINIGEEVLDFSISNGKLREVITNKNTYQTANVVFCGGVWASGLLKKTGLKIPLQAGKGYKFDVYSETKIRYPAILMEAKAAVTPMNGFTRFGGTMELSGINHKIVKRRVKAIAKAATNYYNGLEEEPKETEKAQCGLRPISPDGLPYIGRIPNLENAWVTCGHAMMGWSLGPASGKLVSQLVANQKPDMDLSLFKPGRFG